MAFQGGDKLAQVQATLASGDEARATGLLLTMLSDAAGGAADVSALVQEVVQGVFHCRWNAHVKKLAYDLCKAVPISDEDTLMHIIPGIKSDLDVEATASPEMAQQALRYLPHLPHHLLADMFEMGEIDQLLEPVLSATQPEVRAAAVSSLGRILLAPGVLQAAAKTTGTAQLYARQWQNITDSLLDESAFHAVPAALSATTGLLSTALSTRANSAADSGSSTSSAFNASPAGVLLQRLAWVAAARIAAALGPVLQMCAAVPHTAQVDVARLLLLVVAEALRDPAAWMAAGRGPRNGLLDNLLPLNLLLPTLTVLVPSALSHLASMAHSRGADAGVRLEACRAILKISAMVGSSDASCTHASLSMQGLSAPSIPLPTSYMKAAIQGLLDLEEGGLYLVEAGSHEVVGVAVEGLATLPLGMRQHLLGRLWPAVARVRDAPLRMRLFAAAWAAVVEPLHSPGLVNLTMKRVFEDAFLMKAITGQEGGQHSSAAQMALKAHQQHQQEEEDKKMEGARKHQEELKEQQQKAGLANGANGAAGEKPTGENGGTKASPAKAPAPSPAEQQRQQFEAEMLAPKRAKPPREVEEGGQQPAQAQGAVRLTAALPSKKKKPPPRPPGAANQRFTSAAPPPRPPASGRMPPPGRPAGAAPGGQLAASSAAELERENPTKGKSSLTSGVLSMFKTSNTKSSRSPHPLDAAHHSTQQYDSPEAAMSGQQARAQPTKQEAQKQAIARAAEQPNEALPHPSLKAEQQGGGGGGGGAGASAGGHAPVDKGGSSSSVIPKPVASTMNSTVSTLGSIVTLGGMLGGGKDENEWAKHANVETEDLPPLGVLRHEVAATLLGVVATHPAAAAARELCKEAATAAAHDKKPVPASVGGIGVLAQQPGMAHELQAWLLLTGRTLNATKACLSWEPLVQPAITPHLSQATASRVSADFSTAAADMWLQLLLAAASALPTLKTTLCALQEQLANAKLMRAAAGEASDEDEDPLGLGVNDEDDDDSDDSSDSSGSGYKSGKSSKSKSDDPDNPLSNPSAMFSINRGPRALRVGGVDMREQQEKQQKRAQLISDAKALAAERAAGGDMEAAKKLGSKEERRRARRLAKREARRPRTQLELLIGALEEEEKGLDAMLKELLAEWNSLNRALRPRVLWVVARCMYMPPAPDQKWELGLRVLHEVLCRPLATLAATRAAELMTSAANGAMYQSGRQGWPRDRPFTFDIAAASALCEGPDYDTASLVVGFTAAQQWTLLLQDALAAGGRDPDPRLQEDVFYLAGRMDDMLRACLAGSEASGAPGLREWAKRMLRCLATIALYKPPGQIEREEADKKMEAKRRKRKAKRKEQRRKEGGGNEGSSTSTSEDDNDAPAEDDSDLDKDGGSSTASDSQAGGQPNPFERQGSNKSGSSSSSIDGTGGTMPVAMPPSLFMLQNMNKGQPPPQPGAPTQPVDAEGLPTHGQMGPTASFAGGTVEEVEAEAGANGFAQGTRESTDPGQQMMVPGGEQDDEEAREAAKTRLKEEFRSRAETIGQSTGSIAQVMLQTGAVHALWGYPFAWGPRAASLAPSRRTRRSRTLALHISAALAYILRGAPMLPGLLPGSLGVQQLMPQSARARIEEGPAYAVSWGAACLDSPVFWSALPVEPADAPILPPPSLGNPGAGLGSQVELTGPADPLLICGCISCDVQDPTRQNLKAQLTVTNRTECDVRGALMHVSVYGPALVREASLLWPIPRLNPQDRVSHSVPLRLLGYGRVELQVRLQLLPSAVFAAAALELSGATSATVWDIENAGTVPLHLACEPLRVSLVSHMLKPPPPSSLSITPAGFFRTWSALPSRVELAGVAVWPGREGAALALSSMLRQPLTNVALNFIPASASYHAAFVGETGQGEELLIVVVGQLMPPLSPPPPPVEEGGASRNKAKERYNFLLDLGVSKPKEADDGALRQKVQRVLGGTAGEEACVSGRALFNISARTPSPTVAAAIQREVRGAFVVDLAPGTLECMADGSARAAAPRVQGQGGGLKPPLHPRVAALHASFQQGVRALPTSVREVLGSGVGPLAGGTCARGATSSPSPNSAAAGADGAPPPAIAAGAVLDPHVQGAAVGAKVSHRWLQEAALAEWQRLTALSS